MSRYNVQNWYWIVGASTTQVYSSASASYVPVSDSAYIAWIELGNYATRIDTEENLQEVFAQQYPAGWPASAAAQALAVGSAAIANGIAITSTSTPAINGTYALTQTTQIDLLGALSYCLLKNQFPGNLSSFTFFDAAGAPHAFSSIPEFELFAEAVASYLDPILNYINSGGTVGQIPANNQVTIA